MEDQIPQGPHFHSLHPESQQGASHEFFWYAQGWPEDVKHLFHMDVTLVDGLILEGGEWPSVPWYPDTPLTGAATLGLSWFIKIHCACFPRVHAIKDFTKADKDNGGEDDKDDNKQTKLKSKRSSHKTTGRQKSSSSRKVNLPDDNLDEFFGSSQDKNKQETVDVMPTDLPKKSEETEW